MPVKVIPSGTRYGRLTTTGKYELRKGNACFECICDCGSLVWKRGKDLRYGNVKSCGCLQKDTARKKAKHGMYNTRIYKTYNAMKERCYNEKCSSYYLYGKRGISICDEWLGEKGFVNFYNWATQNGYKDNLTIDRIDSNGNYEPLNCRWADYKTQSNNTRRNHYITHNGKTQTMAQWANELGISYQALNSRINISKMSIEDAFRTEKMNNHTRGAEIVRKTEAFGEKKYLYEWANENGLNPSTISSRVNKGMSIEDAISTRKMQKLPQSQLEKMFEDYYNGDPEDSICKKYGISRASLCRYRKRYGKPKRDNKFSYETRRVRHGY